MTEEQIVNRYNHMRQEQSAIMSRIAEVENESHEHELVAEALRPLNSDRCCHRLVGGALVERTVGEVLPEIEENLKGLREVLSKLTKGLAEKDKEMEEFMALHKLNRPGKSDKVSASDDGKDARGVLA